MPKTTLAAVISSVLLGASSVHAQPANAPPQETQTQATTPAQGSQSTGSSTQETGPTSGDNEPVGTTDSNVDEKSSSGSYYPYSAGTAGDDPAQPTSTSPTPNEDGFDGGPTDQWTSGDMDGDGYLSRDELGQLAPALKSSFPEMDVDRDGKLTRAEYRAWRLSKQARMDADQPGTAQPSAPVTPSPAAPSGSTTPATQTPTSPNSTAPSDSTPGSTDPDVKGD